jgi:hypothetical protein
MGNHRVNAVACGGWNRWINKWYSLSYFSEIFNVIISTAREDTSTHFFFWRPTNRGSLQASLDHSFQITPPPSTKAKSNCHRGVKKNSDLDLCLPRLDFSHAYVQTGKCKLILFSSGKLQSQEKDFVARNC